MAKNSRKRNPMHHRNPIWIWRNSSENLIIHLWHNSLYFFSVVITIAHQANIIELNRWMLNNFPSIFLLDGLYAPCYVSELFETGVLREEVIVYQIKHQTLLWIRGNFVILLTPFEEKSWKVNIFSKNILLC